MNNKQLEAYKWFFGCGIEQLRYYITTCKECEKITEELIKHILEKHIT